jgi:hypothetical protein
MHQIIFISDSDPARPGPSWSPMDDSLNANVAYAAIAGRGFTLA